MSGWDAIENQLASFRAVLVQVQREIRLLEAERDRLEAKVQELRNQQSLKEIQK